VLWECRALLPVISYASYNLLVLMIVRNHSVFLEPGGLGGGESGRGFFRLPGRRTELYCGEGDEWVFDDGDDRNVLLGVWSCDSGWVIGFRSAVSSAMVSVIALTTRRDYPVSPLPSVWISELVLPRLLNRKLTLYRRECGKSVYGAADDWNVVVDV
jgi:hypothetical protein